MLVTADVECAGRASLILGLHPHEISDDVDAVLPDSIELATVSIPQVEVSFPELQTCPSSRPAVAWTPCAHLLSSQVLMS